jgi:threonine/homoserine/homoserine lactone efflux protein
VPDATRSRRRDDGTVTLGAAVISFAIVARVLTVTSGLDTALVLLIALSGALSRRLRRSATVRGIDGRTGVTLVGFGVRLAFAGR